MRNYQPKSGGKHHLPHNLYMQIQYKIFDCERLKEERQMLLYGSPQKPNGQPRAKSIGDPTGSTASRLAQIDTELSAIEQSAAEIIKEYVGYVQGDFDPMIAFQSYEYFNSMFFRQSRDDDGPSRRTWSYYKNMFSRKIAKKLNML